MKNEVYYRNKTIEEVRDDLEDFDQQVGEIEAEHLGETARFGDSWPGAQIQLSEANESLAELRKYLEAREAAFVGPIPMTWFETERFWADQKSINFVGPEQPFPF
jgi:hypothetical protein